MKKVPASTSPANHWHAGRVELLKGENDPLIDAFVEVSRLFKLRHKAAEYEALLKAADDRRSEVRTYLGDLIVNHLSVENPFVAAELEDRLLSTPSR